MSIYIWEGVRTPAYPYKRTQTHTHNAHTPHTHTHTLKTLKVFEATATDFEDFKNSKDF